MNPVLAEIMATQKVSTRSGERIDADRGGGVDMEEGLFLQSVIRSMTPSPRHSLEVGFALGISALFLCDVLSVRGGVRHVVIDPFQNHGPESENSDGIGLDNIGQAGYESLVDFREAPSHLALPSLIADGLTFDFALIDGWTTFDAKLTDFVLIDRLLRIGGVVAIRAGYTQAGAKVCRYISTNRPDYGTRALLPDSDGGPWGGAGADITAFEKLSEDRRFWKFHVDF